MPSLSSQQAALLATDRWSWLPEFASRWYAEPLRAEDGSPPEEITAAADRIGCALPSVLTEWFTLVGRRLQPVQDAPVTPKNLVTFDGMVVVWVENQGCWLICAATDDGDDPICFLGESEYYRFDPVPLTEVLRAMLLSDTLVGAWDGRRRGPFGPLAPLVRGGMFMDPAPAELATIADAYQRLPIPVIPDFGQSLRGDQATVVRGGARMEWMTADDAAFERLGGLVELEPEGGDHEVVLAFEGLTSEQRSLVTDHEDVPDRRRVQEASTGLGRVHRTVTSPDEVRFHLITTRPDETTRALIAAVPDPLTDRMVLATRPIRVGVFRVVHPAGRTEYVLPSV